ncbi:hypothetical protein [Flavobacterium sp. LC2016-12]|uniref:hypothetical protein n=1 Tax=Flavobacterium sp. LC2016-12 TaxID=2783794 RepID=UPI00188A13E6|nr:hypothetical protein [Flavobacterium sp. LC2016-12]MBF4466709.1 hypothetical protein [Flavobacterium sp. LC2016-12]
MENKKEIGKLFKDKLELLDKKPTDRLWESIENDLDKKRKRRILFWLVPSLLLVGIATLFFINQSNTNEVSLEQKQVSASPSNQTQDNNKSVQSQEIKTTISKSTPTAKSTTAKSSETKTTIKKSRTEKLIKQSSKLLVSTDEYEEYEVVKKYKVVIKKNKTITTTHKNSTTKAVKTNIKENVAKTGKKTTSKNKKKTVKSTKKSAIKTVKKTSEPKEKKTSVNKNTETQTPISNTEKTATEVETIKKDSVAPKPQKKQTPKREYIKKDYPEQENEDDAEYSVSVYYGPAIFGSLSNASTLNESFSNVSKSHPVTSHYGFYFKSMWGKYGFKAGFAKINLKISNHLNNQSNINFDNMVLSNNNIYNVMQNDEDIRLVQKISYYEIPLEFNYALKKDETPFGMEAFTGFSTLISDANQLYLSSNNLESEGIGSTKNLNKMNISFNLGIGFNYKLTEHLQADFNPIFKYYLTTFKNDKEPKPYSLSIQSGITYKF